MHQSGSSLELPPIHLNQKQDEFIFANEPFVCIKGTFGCGKSMAALLAVNKECEENPGNLYFAVRKEYIDLKSATFRDWNDWVGRPIIGNEVRYENGSVLIFAHGDDLNSFKNANLGGALMIQAEEMTEEDFWFLKGRLRRKQGTRQLRLDCNYDGHNWIYKLFNKEDSAIKEHRRLITTNTFDNEKNLPPDYIPGLMLYPKKLQDRYLYGSDADMEGQIWDEFSESRDFIDPFEIPKEWDKIVILDHGVTNPTAVLWIAIDFDGNLFAYDEHYEAGKIVSYHSEQIKKRDNSRVVDWLGDPACNAKVNQRNGQFYSIFDEYAECGIKFRPADNNVISGLNRVNEYFKAGKLKIFKNCVNLKDEIDNYRWKRLNATQSKDKNEPEQPVKKKDHLCDCLRYGVASRPSLTPQPEKKIVRYSEAWYHSLEPVNMEEN